MFMALSLLKPAQDFESDEDRDRNDADEYDDPYGPRQSRAPSCRQVSVVSIPVSRRCLRSVVGERRPVRELAHITDTKRSHAGRPANKGQGDSD